MADDKEPVALLEKISNKDGYYGNIIRNNNQKTNDCKSIQRCWMFPIILHSREEAGESVEWP